MAQLQSMDARLDTISIKMYQVNVRVDRIARRQATMGGFAPQASPSPPSIDFDFDDDNGDDDNVFEDDDDRDASSIDEMST